MKIEVDIARIRNGAIVAESHVNECQCGYRWVETGIIERCETDDGEPLYALFAGQVADYCSACGRKLTP